VHSLGRRVNGTPCDNGACGRVVKRSDQMAGGIICEGDGGRARRPVSGVEDDREGEV
jgi:hypothetical protein